MEIIFRCEPYFLTKADASWTSVTLDGAGKSTKVAIYKVWPISGARYAAQEEARIESK
jgi:hypothetical protein